jgi:hypothetical protein
MSNAGAGAIAAPLLDVELGAKVLLDFALVYRERVAAAHIGAS